MKLRAAITKCKKPSISKRFEAWCQNKAEREFQKRLESFSRNDLISWRSEKEWTQEDFAEWCGRTRRWVQMLESGEQPIPLWLVRLIFMEDEK
jgi:DNA-binding XRE family transcriptional regulator